MIIVFALFDLLPALRDLAFDRKYLPVGGLLSGFFGGLSGNQGALRSAFLIKTGLSKEAFIGTNTVSAVIVDVTRLLVYGVSFYALRFQMIDSEIGGMVVVATLCAFAGSFLGTRLMKKVTLHAVQIVVGIMLIGVGVGMIVGVL
ncbi:MAG: TSUP family transporter [Caldilinea sp.]